MNPVKFIFFHLPEAIALSCIFVSCWGGKGKDVTPAGLLDEMISVEEGARYPAIPYRAFSVAGQMENVLFNKQGPGVITRIFLTTEDQDVVLRFYFDGDSEAGMTVPACELSLPDLMEDDGGLLCHHPDQGTGSVLYLPIPYSKSCLITLENTSAPS